jgi:hypothetical protein
MTTKTKKILIGIGSLLFGLFYSLIQNDLSFITIIVYSICPILLSLLLMLIYTILISLFEKNYKIEFVNTFFTFWIGSIVLSIIGIYGSMM